MAPTPKSKHNTKYPILYNLTHIISVSIKNIDILINKPITRKYDTYILPSKSSNLTPTKQNDKQYTTTCYINTIIL